MSKIQLISAILLLIGALYIIRCVRKRKMELKYALPWMAVVVCVFIVDCIPGILYRLADLMGIDTPVNALFLIALCFAICLIFVLTVIVSRQSDRIKQLAQTVALNEERIRALEQEREKSV
ncbi:MAG: DUF2304 domain-containing protein [Lachnospiraceae bacterium]